LNTEGCCEPYAACDNGISISTRDCKLEPSGPSLRPTLRPRPRVLGEVFATRSLGYNAMTPYHVMSYQHLHFWYLLQRKTKFNHLGILLNSCCTLKQTNLVQWGGKSIKLSFSCIQAFRHFVELLVRTENTVNKWGGKSIKLSFLYLRIQPILLM